MLFAALLALFVSTSQLAWAQCPVPSVTITASDESPVDAGSGTYVSVANGGTATVESCATATATGPTGTIYLNGGVVSVNIPSTYRTIGTALTVFVTSGTVAEATSGVFSILGSVAVSNPSVAQITAAPGATVNINGGNYPQIAGTSATITLNGVVGAQATVTGGSVNVLAGSGNRLDATSAVVTVLPDSSYANRPYVSIHGGSLYLSGGSYAGAVLDQSATAYFTNAPNVNVAITGTATATVVGGNNGLALFSTAGAGTVYMSGRGHTVGGAGPSQTATVLGPGGNIDFRQGGVAYLSGSGVNGNFAGGASATIIGDSGYAQFTSASGYASVTGGIVYIGPAAQVDIPANGVRFFYLDVSGSATVSSGIPTAQAQSAATATMLLGATITAHPNAALIATAADTTFASLGTVAQGRPGRQTTYTIYEARLYASPAARRRARAMATQAPKCSFGLTACDVTGLKSWECVDVRSDIFNCGGCANGKGVGIDCTALFDGGVQCRDGTCINVDS